MAAIAFDNSNKVDTYTRVEIDSIISELQATISSLQSQVEALGSAYVLKAGDTMTGTLNANVNSSGTSYRVYGAVAN